MKTKLLASLAAVFILANLAAAQGYYIRITNNTNLRASHSLKAAVSETASAGSTLHVIGAFNRWLKIDRSGDEMWMADWVPYTRVADSGQADSGQMGQTPAHIDNCCFVDRQCSADEEWVRGYWAFQNNECTVPAPALHQSWLQVASDGLIIEGTERFVSLIKQVIRFLNNRSPQWYAYATGGLDRIRLVEQMERRSNVNLATATWTMSQHYIENP